MDQETLDHHALGLLKQYRDVLVESFAPRDADGVPEIRTLAQSTDPLEIAALKDIELLNAVIGAMSGGNTLPQLRAAMRAADAIAGAAAPHVHPRIEPAMVAPLLESAGFVKTVIDVDRVPVSYPNLGSLIADLRAMGATNILAERPRTSLGKAGRAAAERTQGGTCGSRGTSQGA